MDKKIRRLIYRYKYLVYLFVAVIGALLAYMAQSKLPENHTEPIVYDIMMGIGCSVIATAFVTIILLSLLPDDIEENEQKKALETWGIISIHNERKNIQLQRKIPKRQLDFIAFGLEHFRKANVDHEISKRIKSGLNIRIITLHPKSMYVAEHQLLENGGDLRGDIERLLQWKDQIISRVGETHKGTIEIKLYDSLPLDFYCQADNKIYVGPYLPGEISSNVITYEFSADSQGGVYYSKIFEELWNENRGIEFLNADNDIPYIIGNQQQCVEEILRYFCGEVKGPDGNDVIGVVVLFKQNLRRTIFSHNKPEKETHKCHEIGKGAVGKLFKLNPTQSLGKTLFFRDYVNNLAFLMHYTGREVNLKKIDSDLKKFREDEMTAILAAPIMRDSKMIGAVTFDFSKLSTEYKNQINTMKALKTDVPIDDGLVIEKWFSMAMSCSEMIAPLLGNAIEAQYKKLYEEEWSSND